MNSLTHSHTERRVIMTLARRCIAPCMMIRPKLQIEFCRNIKIINEQHWSYTLWANGTLFDSYSGF